MQKVISISMFALFLFSCGNRNNNSQVANENMQLTGGELYNDTNLLMLFDEPVLDKILSSETYRLIYLRTFNNPIIVRLEKDEGRVKIYWKITDGMSGYDYGKMFVNETKALSMKKWKEFEKMVDNKRFWSLRSFDNEMPPEDGSTWLIEGKKQGKYNLVGSWGGGAIEVLGRKLLELTDIKFDEENSIY